MNDKETKLYLEAALWADSEVRSHADWPSESLVVLRRIVFRIFIEGSEYAKDNP